MKNPKIVKTTYDNKIHCVLRVCEEHKNSVVIIEADEKGVSREVSVPSSMLKKLVINA